MINFILIILTTNFHLINYNNSNEWTYLFNGKNLDGWEIKIRNHEIGNNFKSNQVYEKDTSYLRNFNKTNTGQNVLAFGDIKSFPLSIITRIVFTLPKINSVFWDKTRCLGSSNLPLLPSFI